MPSLHARDIFGDDDCDHVRHSQCYDRSNWDSYGRWVVVAVLVVAAFLLFFLFACITARRRRRAGFAPYRGTGWAGGRPPPSVPYNGPYHGGNQYSQPPPQVAAPPYSAPNQGPYGGNQGYFGGQQTGVEMQPPQNVYQSQRGGDPVYEPPSGPPPQKGGDGIVR